MVAGITGVRVTSNTRDASWDGMKRKEAYASPGPRNPVRCFGHYDLLTDAAAIAATAYAMGAPMGGDRKPDAASKLPAVGNTVDLTTATFTNSIGATELAGTFTDPDFDPKARAFYSARAIEIPTWRRTIYDTVKYKVTMAPAVPMMQHERAVTSPIWYAHLSTKGYI